MQTTHITSSKQVKKKKLQVFVYKKQALVHAHIAQLVLTNDSISDGDLQPHPVSDLEAWVWQLHHLDDGGHVCFTCRQRQVIKFCETGEDFFEKTLTSML